jgi:uncharacterized protein (DUF58 family)
MPADRLIPPEIRRRLRDLRLVARRARGDQGIGLHASRSRGTGLEFAQYRSYEPGDELRLIDWKLYARSDKFFVREAERESPVAIWILIDLSASMGQADEGNPGWTRLDAAKALAASIAEVALYQGDRFACAGLSGEGLRIVAPGNGARQRDQLLLALHRMRADGGVPTGPALARLWERIGANDLVIMLSDCFDEGVVALMERLSAARRELLAIQLLTVGERDFPYRGGHRFHDPETREELLGDGPALRADFLRRFAEARAALGQRLDAAGIRHTAYVLDEPLDAPLRRLFGGRV